MSVEDCPPEVIETIVEHLDLRDICSLRLSSRSLAANATQKHFKSYFRSKRLQLTEPALTNFVAVTMDGRLGRLVRDLTLTGVVYNHLELEHRVRERGLERDQDDQDSDDDSQWRELSEQELDHTASDLCLIRERQADQVIQYDSGVDAVLLSRAFGSLAKDGAFLESLTLEIEVYRDDPRTPCLPLFGGSWKQIWRSAAHVTQAAFSSLAASALPVQRLTLFNSDRMQRCSLACNELSDIDWTSRTLASSLAGLRVLSLSLSDRIITTSNMDAASSGDPHDEWDWQQKIEYRPKQALLQEARQRGNFEGLAAFLSMCPKLEELSLHRFAMDHRAEVSKVHNRGLLNALSNMRLPLLRKLELGGFETCEEDLLDILKRYPMLSSTILQTITLLKGTFRSILDFCTMEAEMEELRLHNLHEGCELVLFESPWAATHKSGPAGGDYRWRAAHYLRRDAASLREGQRVDYHTHGRLNRCMDTPMTRGVREDTMCKFGPPGRGLTASRRRWPVPQIMWRT